MGVQFSKYYIQKGTQFVETLYIRSIHEGQWLDYRGKRILLTLYNQLPHPQAVRKTLSSREVLKMGDKYKLSLPPGDYFLYDI